MQISCDCNSLFGKLITVKLKNVILLERPWTLTNQKGEMPSVCNKPDATQSRPLTGVSSVICA